MPLIETIKILAEYGSSAHDRTVTVDSYDTAIEIVAYEVWNPLEIF